MFQRLALTYSGRNLQAVADEPVIDAAHLRQFRQLLADTPATLANVALAQLGDDQLTMEWQAVFQGAGVVYLRLNGSVVAVAVLLAGRFVSSENAAIDAIQQMLFTGKVRGAGFETIRKHRDRPLRAVVFVDENPRPDLTSAILYWTDCLAKSYFASLSSMPAEANPDLSTTDFFAASV